MRKYSFGIVVAILTFLCTSFASAHQPVNLLNSDSSAEKGPLLVDGTISFAVNASFTKSGEQRGFRANLKAGENLSVQYLIIDKAPANKLKNSQLPTLTITTPSGSKIEIKINERTKFFEPFSKTNYLFLSRYSAPAQAGTYSFLLRSKSKADVTIAVGDREIPGEVSRIIKTEMPSVSPSPSVSTSASASQSSSAAASSGYTMVKVKQNNSATSCWSAINGKVYDLTKWINLHPGGAAKIKAICGVDGSASFNIKHGGSSDVAETLKGYLLGPLE